ncbi:thioredoxin-like protein, chloroplastic [Raphidocelis subcapitata]|uniref:Thioredoxin-like protein, chloroplastic n=1 Tax=Raphidocelis subcapitata TaxID=307507 RepID=A0A2V0NPW6_9CHLO|nr:thioredoxin-like protein, chloroplastic [Raphidocelis subcapitata]|eukprot:GBF87553.1 thioredoxin-like protein, chloroplastic [Raphidocelis subcapitata]
MALASSSVLPVAPRAPAATAASAASAARARRSPRARAPRATGPMVEDAIAAQMEETQRRRAELRAEMAAVRRKAQEEAASLPWWEVDCPPNMVNVETVEQLASSLELAAAADKLAVVAFFSPECYGCRSLQPKLRQLARDSQERAVFLKVNGYTEELRDYCDRQGITQIPFFHFYRHGALVAAFSANMQPEKLRLLRRQLEVHSAPGADAEAAAERAASVSRA